jgi:hypothetical protein
LAQCWQSAILLSGAQLAMFDAELAF